MAKPTVILVHGAWADGSSWARVIPLLVGDGVAAVAVQLPLTTLADDVATVRRALGRVEGEAVLVAHSYGGVVITEAGTEAKVRGLVYIAAFAPDAGESANSLSASLPATALGGEIRPDPEGFITLTEAGVCDDFAQDLTGAEKTLLFATQAPTNGAALNGAVSEPAWKSKPSWYLVATADRAIQPSLEKTMAAHIGAETIEVDTCYVAMLSHPRETFDLIQKAVASVSARA
jgi:pimeloyl-ACP methyl ester carboxylesterase